MTTLGTSDLDVFPICLGGNVFGWTADEPTSHAVLDAYTGAGGNFIDTADVYSAWKDGNSGGESEAIIGTWLAGRRRRDDVIVATKVASHAAHPGLTAANIVAACDASLARLHTSHIDLYYAHRDTGDAPLAETIEAFDALIKAGKIQHWGLSNFSGARIEEVLSTADDGGWARPVALQSQYNLVAREPYESDSVPVLTRENLAGVPYYGLASGFLTGKYQRGAQLPAGARTPSAAKFATEAGFRVIDALEQVANLHGTQVATVALAWLLAKPGVSAPIASASKPFQVRDLVAAAGLALTADQVALLDAASNPADATSR